MKSKVKIIADSKIPFLRGVLEPFSEISYIDPMHITNESVKNADALIIRTRTKCNAKLLEKSSIKFIASTTTGFDHIDTAFCDMNGIKWINAPGSNSNSVMQYMASAILTLANQKNIPLDKLTIGIVGVGNVGSKVEKLAKIFGMKILLNDPPRERKEGGGKFIPLDFLIANSNIITLHVPLRIDEIDKTYHMFDDKLFEKFNAGKILINTSRGEVVSTTALKRAIKKRIIRASILDVWENEPEIDHELLNLVDIATPHIAGYSTEGRANATAVCVNALNNYFNLDLKQNWYPDHITSSQNSQVIEIDCMNKTHQEILHECINLTYNIINDDNLLRNSIRDFEKQREGYPARREFNYYNINLIDADESIKKGMRDIRFNLL